jgi:Dienelactone hydrolase family
MPYDYAGLRAPVLIHIADCDAINPPPLAEELDERISADARTKPEIDNYPAGHAFLNEEDLLGTYDVEQARIAWDRAVAFLGAHLGKGPAAGLVDIVVTTDFVLGQQAFSHEQLRGRCAVHEVRSDRLNRLARGPRYGDIRQANRRTRVASNARYGGSGRD